MLGWLIWMGCATPTPSPVPTLQATMGTRPLTYTRHGECRMACRGIDEGEVRSVLATGTLIPERSRDDGRCPSHALEGRGTDGHRLRIVYAACATETKVVTAIDLDEDHHCSCP